MNNPAFRFNRLEDYLVLHHTRDRSFMVKDGYRYLCDLRMLMASRRPDFAPSLSYSNEEMHKFRQFLAFLASIGFINEDAWIGTCLDNAATKPGKQTIALNNRLYDELHYKQVRHNLPENLYIEIMNKPDDREAARGFLSLRQFKLLFSQFEAMGGKYITFAGSEPFAWKGFLNVLKLTADFGFGIEIITDGSLLNLRNVALLQHLKIDKLLIPSLETSSKHLPDPPIELLRNKLHKGIQLLKQHGIKYTVVCPVSNNIRSSFNSLRQLAEKNSKESLYQDSLPQIMNYHLTVNTLAHNCSNQGGIQFSNKVDGSSADKPVPVHINTKRALHLKLNGEIFWGLNNSNSLGNLHDTSLQEICFSKLGLSESVK